MKKIIIFLLITLIILLTPKTTFARDITLYKDQTIDKAYFEYGNNVEIEGTINGDAFIAGSNVKVSGIINGDLFVLSENIEITGAINGGIRAVGSNITINSSVTGSALLISSDTKISKEASINKDLLGISQKFELDGNVGRDLVLVGDETKINGQITRNFTYYSSKEANIDSNASILGQVSQKDIDNSNTKNAKRPFSSLGDLFFSVFSTLLVAFIFNKLFPNKIKELATTTESFSKMVVLGAFYLLIIPIVSFLLIVTVLSIPLALITFALYGIALYFSKIVFAYFLAFKIKTVDTTSILKPVFFGLLIIEMIKFVPVAGFILALIGTLWGFGRITFYTKNSILKK